MTDVKSKVNGATSEALVKKVRRGVSNETHATSKLSFHEKDDVPSPTYHAASGSKTAATAQATGIGLQLNFTDTAIWDAIKADVEDKKSINRIFDVKLDEAEEAKYNNGKEDVSITIYPISFVEDKAPMTRNSKDNTEEA